METDYVFFTATMQAAGVDEPATPAPPPAGGEPDVEPVSRYDTMMQHFRTACPDWTDKEIADHIELMDADPFTDDVRRFLESMD